MYQKKDENLIMGEISIKGINKATGINRILKYYDYPLKDTIAIGDSLNDLKMIERAAIGVCMGNGHEFLKQRTDYVTDCIHNDGFVKALKKFNII